MMNVDVSVVGSGAGGSTVSYKLTRWGFKVALLESSGDVGLEKAHLGYHPTLSPIEILRCKCVGGSTLVSFGNMLTTKALISRFKRLGIDLTAEVDEVCRLMHVANIPPDKLPLFAVKFIEVSKRIGLEARIMPKSIDFIKCVGCGKCAYGCLKNAKYTALDLVRMSVQHGLVLLNRFTVDRLHKSGQGEIVVEGVMMDERVRIKCKALVLAAGAIETPQLLAQLHNDENIGKNLFIDPFVTVGGPYDGPSASNGIPMAAYADCGNFLLSPHYSGLLSSQLTMKGIDHEGKSIASVMVKVADEGRGVVWPDGVVEPYMSRRDIKILEMGIEKAKNLLFELGVKDEDVVLTHVRGAHPGGTAAIGYVVSSDLTINGCDGVFVADASLIPPPLGKPPILLIMALAVKVSKRICEYLGKKPG
ncbi:MAG: GMC family oxidoreductase N-terminal domain-containing protein [Candidatus Bathyarchaeota archaeon]